MNIHSFIVYSRVHATMSSREKPSKVFMRQPLASRKPDMIDHFKKYCYLIKKIPGICSIDILRDFTESYIMCLMKLVNLNVSVSFVIQPVFIRLVSKPKC